MERNHIKTIVFEKIREIAELFEDEYQIKEEDIFNNIGFDSLDEVEFILQIEQEFMVGIPDEFLDNLKNKTIKNLVDYIYKNKLNE